MKPSEKMVYLVSRFAAEWPDRSRVTFGFLVEFAKSHQVAAPELFADFCFALGLGAGCPGEPIEISIRRPEGYQSPKSLTPPAASA